MNTTYNSPIVESLDDVMKMRELDERFADVAPSSIELSEAYVEMYQAEEAYMDMMSNYALSELSFYYNTGMLLEANNPTSKKTLKEKIGELIDRFIEWLKAMGRKIAGAWKGFLDRVNSIDFLNKRYLKSVIDWGLNDPKVNNTEFEIEGWDFHWLHSRNLFNAYNVKKELKPDVDTLPNDWVMSQKMDIMHYIFGTAFALNGNQLEFKEITKQLTSCAYRNKFCTGKEDPKGKTTIKIKLGNAIATVQDYEHIMQEIKKKQFGPAIASIDATIFCFNTIKKKGFDKNPDVIKKYMEVAKFNSYALNAALRILHQAHFDELLQAKAVIELAKKQIPKKESASVEDDDAFARSLLRRTSVADLQYMMS